MIKAKDKVLRRLNNIISMRTMVFLQPIDAVDPKVLSYLKDSLDPIWPITAIILLTFRRRLTINGAINMMDRPYWVLFQKTKESLLSSQRWTHMWKGLTSFSD